ADYPVDFTDDEWKALEGAFPTGVCDYTQPGAGQQPTMTWLSYADGPGGVAAAEPSSVAMPSARRCVSRRHFRIRLRGRRLRAVRVYVGSRRPHVLRGRRTSAPIDLRGLPAGR